MKTPVDLAVLIRTLLCGMLVLSGCGTLQRHATPDDDALGRAFANYSAALLLDYELGAESDVSQAHMEQAVSADPNRHRLRSRLAVGLLNRDNDAALAQLRDSCARNPKSIECLLDLAEACRFTGRIDEAIDTYQRAIDLAPGSFAIYHHLAEVYAARGDIDRLLQTLNRAHRKTNPPVFVQLLAQALGRRFTGSGELLYAARLFDFIAATSDDPAVRSKACHTAGQLYAAIDDRKLAEQRFHEAIAAGDPLPYSFLRLADLYLAENPDRALQCLVEGVKTLPEDPLLRASLGQVYSMRGDYDAAIRHFETVYRQLRDSTDTQPTESFYLLYAGVLGQAHQLDRAAELLSECIAKFPDSHKALNFLAYLWAEAGVNLDTAPAHVERALSAEPENPAYLDTRGWIYFKQKQFDRALADIGRASELIGDDAVLADHLGDVYHALGQTQRAVAEWQRSYRLDPGNASVLRKLQDAGAPPLPDPAPPHDSVRSNPPANITP